MPPSKSKAARSALDTLFDNHAAPSGARYSRRKKVNDREDKMGLIGATTSTNAANVARIADAFSNQVARTGYGTSSLENYGDYPLVRWTLNYWSVISFFESSWIARRIVLAPAEDIVKTWPKITSDMEPKDLTRIDRAIRRTNSRSKVREAITKARLFGGAGALIALKGQEKELDRPLDLESIGVHDYRGLIVFDRWSGITPSGDLCDDFDRPLDFGEPEFYMVRTKGGDSYKVHSSRILRFTGPKMPEPENSAYQDWGISVLAPVIDTIRGYDTVASNALSLTFRANILGMRMPDLAGMMSGLSSNQQAAQKFEQRMERLNQMLSNQSMMLLEKDGELSQTQYSFAGLSDMMQMWQLAISGAAKMPVTRLWGRTYSGLGQAGDGDEKIYEETISTESDVTLRPALEKLFPVICMSELGEVPDDLDLSFPSIRVLDEKEKSELSKTVVDTVMVAVNGGVISLRTAAKELKQSSDATGIFTNITDEDIEALSDKVQPEGEMGEGLFEQGKGGLDPAGSPSKVGKEETHEGKASQEGIGSTTEVQGPPEGAVEEASEGRERAEARDSRPYTVEQIRALVSRPMGGKVQSKLVQNRIIRDLAEQGYFYWVNEAESAKELGRDKPEIDAAEVEAAKYKVLLNSAGAKDVDLRTDVTKCQWCGMQLDGDDVAEVNGSVVCPDCADAYGRGRANDVKPWSAAKLAVVEALRSAGFRITSDSNYAYIVWFGTEAPDTRKPDLDLRATVSGNGQYEMGVWVRGAYVTTERGFKPEHVQQQVLKYVQRAKANDADGPAVAKRIIHDLPVTIECKRGQWRTGQGWRIKMNYDYGYFVGVPGADGDSLDICIGPDPASTWVYVFDQKHLPPRKGFDEHKVFCHYASLGDAVKAFNAGHDKACQVYLDVTPMQVDDFKLWLKKHDMSKPAGMVKP